MTTAMDVVSACEGRLGWLPRRDTLKARQDEAGKLKAQLAETKHITLDDLMLAVEYSYRRRQPVASPLTLIYRVSDAKKLANAPVITTDLTDAVDQALEVEYGRDASDPERVGWIGKLTRAHGEYRSQVLQEWQEAGRAA